MSRMIRRYVDGMVLCMAANSTHSCSLPLQKLNAFLERVMSAGLIEDGTVAADMSKVCYNLS